jgi:hypothetical protein
VEGQDKDSISDVNGEILVVLKPGNGLKHVKTAQTAGKICIVVIS